jgi:hypothetical protein
VNKGPKCNPKMSDNSQFIKLIEICGNDSLGRSFKIKLWPTLIFLQDGRELARAVRPTSIDELRSCMQVLLDGSTSS